MLEIRDLAVEVAGKLILKGINLHIGEGEVHALLGPNGSGKTSLIMAILGFPEYKVVRGSIKFKGVELTSLTTDERVRLGIGVAFQRPPEIRGVKLADMLILCKKTRQKKKEEAGETKAVEGEPLDEDVLNAAKRLKFSEDFLRRDVNLGFSGGEVKRAEILQLLIQDPDFFLFDEPDSGVDIENVELIGEVINEMLQRNKKPSQRKKSALIITHTGFIFNYVKADRAHVLLDGKIACSGMPDEIIRQIMEEGFEKCVRECLTKENT